MKITEYIRSKVEVMPHNYIFTSKDFVTDQHKMESIIRTLNRMALWCEIIKVAKGKYCLPPSKTPVDSYPFKAELVQDLLQDGDQIKGYLTGLTAYKMLGLTTKEDYEIHIGCNGHREEMQIGQYTIHFARQRNIITLQNIRLLQILDAMRHIKRIPDTTVLLSCEHLLRIIKSLRRSEVEMLVRLSKKYLPATRALLGAMLETLYFEELAGSIYRSMVSNRLYDLKGVGRVIHDPYKWKLY